MTGFKKCTFRTVTIISIMQITRENALTPSLMPKGRLVFLG